MYKSRKNFVIARSGFTLIELLIVITIIGILSGVLLGIVNPVRVQNRARDGVRIANIDKLATIVNSIQVADGYLPVDQDTLISSPFLTSWPDGKPTTDDEYVYAYDSEDNTFRVYVLGSQEDYILYASTYAGVVRCPQPSSPLGDCYPLDTNIPVVPPEEPPEEPPAFVPCASGVCNCGSSYAGCPKGSLPSCTVVVSPCSASLACTKGEGYHCCTCIPDSEEESCLNKGIECKETSQCCTGLYCISNVCADNPFETP